MSTSRLCIKIASERFDADAAGADFRAANREAGAIATFLGQVRGENGRVQRLLLEHYPGFAEAEIELHVKTALERWPLEDVLVIHRVGELRPGDTIVFLAAASRHRRAAFESVDFLMDYLKSEAPFWKRETTPDGAAWIEPRTEDHRDRARWHAK